MSDAEICITKQFFRRYDDHRMMSLYVLLFTYWRLKIADVHNQHSLYAI